MMPGMMISLTGVGMECYFDYQIVHCVLWVSVFHGVIPIVCLSVSSWVICTETYREDGLINSSGSDGSSDNVHDKDEEQARESINISEVI